MSECEPQALFPTIPPILHLFDVEVSGPKKRPIFLKLHIKLIKNNTWFNPYPSLFLVYLKILFIYLETSTMIPELTTCPASEVPPALIVTPVFLLLAKDSIFPDIRYYLLARPQQLALLCKQRHQ